MDAVKAVAALMLVVAVVGGCGRVAQVFRREIAVFHPPHGPIARPPAFGALAALLDVTFSSAKGAQLRGWMLPSRNGATIIMTHGSEGDRRQLLPQASMLSERGYGVLLFDWPGHGESSGRVVWGDGERLALAAAIDFVAAQAGHDGARIGALGFSMGGAIVAQVAAYDSRLRAVVLEGTFADAVEQTRYMYGRSGIVLQWPARLGDWWAGMDLAAMRPIDAVGAIAPRPLLLIGGAQDPVVPAWMVRHLYDAARDPKEIWIVPDAGHGEYQRLAAEEYAARIGAFFDHALGI